MSSWPEYLYTTTGAAAGAVTALFLRQWESMSRTQIAVAVFVGFSFSFFVSPLLYSNLSNKQVAGGIFYLVATGSNVLIPQMVKWVSSLMPGKDAP
jgi:di/tricarboxylate transporter